MAKRDGKTATVVKQRDLWKVIVFDFAPRVEATGLNPRDKPVTICVVSPPPTPTARDPDAAAELHKIARVLGENAR
ncbi:MAG TPA: hypothetical protein VGM87_25560 [Roseomonas sp.]|jgi:hypothetical protein